MTTTSCSECGSNELVESGTFRHGSWIRELICLTCENCSAIMAMAGGLVDAEPA
jgi:hypothetical protein